MRRLILLAVLFLVGCPKPIKAPKPVPAQRPRPHSAAMTAGTTGIQVTVNLVYDNATPFAGKAEILENEGCTAPCNVTTIVSMPFDSTGSAFTPLVLEQNKLYSAHVYDDTGKDILGPIPILTSLFDLSQVGWFTLSATIRKADGKVISPYSIFVDPP